MRILRGDTLFTGKVTFEQDLLAKKDAVVDGYLNGTADYSNKFYVSSVTGADVPQNGGTWQKPFATLEYAINKCTANYGDVIIVLPGHNEGITSAAAIDFDIAGISVIGVGNGTLRPTIDFDHADASVAIGANNVTLYNIRFRCSANAITVGLDIEDGVTDATVAYCRFGDAETATDEFAISLRTGDASNRAHILYNEFSAGAQAAVNAIHFAKDTDETLVIGNIITGTYSTAPIAGSTTASTNLLIDGNYFYTGGSADTFNLVAASTGIVSNNYITMNAASAATALDIGNCLNIHNWLIADDDVGGTKAAIEVGSFASVTQTADDA